MPKILSLSGGGTSYASGWTTVNVLPKSNGLGLLQDSSITDNGTVAGTTEKWGVGTVSPTYALQVAPTSGVTAGQTVFIQDNTASTGKTSVVIKGGAVASDSTNPAINVTDSSGNSFFWVIAGGSNTTGVRNNLEVGVTTVGSTGAVQITTAGNILLNGKIPSYNSINTVDNGVPAELGHLDLTAQSAAISATTIYTPTATGRFRISVYEKVTTVDGTSSTLGGSTGTVLTYTDGTDSVAQSVTMALHTTAGAIAINSTGNLTTTTLNGTAFIYAKTGVAIQLAVGYTSNTPGQMIFELHATCEAM